MKRIYFLAIVAAMMVVSCGRDTMDDVEVVDKVVEPAVSTTKTGLLSFGALEVETRGHMTDNGVDDLEYVWEDVATDEERDIHMAMGICKPDGEYLKFADGKTHSYVEQVASDDGTSATLTSTNQIAEDIPAGSTIYFFGGLDSELSEVGDNFKVMIDKFPVVFDNSGDAPLENQAFRENLMIYGQITTSSVISSGSDVVEPVGDVVFDIMTTYLRVDIKNSTDAAINVGNVSVSSTCSNDYYEVISIFSLENYIFQNGEVKCPDRNSSSNANAVLATNGDAGANIAVGEFGSFYIPILPLLAHGSSDYTNKDIMAISVFADIDGEPNMLKYYSDFDATIASINSNGTSYFNMGRCYAFDCDYTGGLETKAECTMEDLQSGNCPDEDIWVITDAGEVNMSRWKVKIPFDKAIHIEMPNATSIINLKDWSNLVSIKLDNVEVMGDDAFGDCVNLKSIDAPKLHTVGGHAFKGCSSLRYLTEDNVPNLATVGEYSLNSDALQKVSLPNVTSFAGKYMFSHCASLVEVNLPNVETFGGVAFSYCPALESISLPKATTFKGDVFMSCDALKSVDCPKAVTFGDRSFNDNPSLTSVNLPEAKKFVDYAFDGCESLESISLPKATEFLGSAFHLCASLKNVDLPLAATFGGNAFYGCTALVGITLPEATTFKGSAFWKCSALTTITNDNLPKVKSFGNYSFAECAALKTVSIASVETFGNYAFSECPVLESVTMPIVNTFGTYAFMNSEALKLCNFGTDREVAMGENAFGTGEYPTTVTITATIGGTTAGSSSGSR